MFRVVLFFVFIGFVLAFQPPVLPNAFNTSFILTFDGQRPDPHHTAFWSYDVNKGGQYVFHPVCPFWGGERGCSLFFAGGYQKPVVYAVESETMFRLGGGWGVVLFFGSRSI